MREDRLVVVFDWETNGRDPQACCPVEVACLAVDPVSLRVVPGSEFETVMRPDDLSTLDDTDEKKKALAVSGLTASDLAGAPVVEAAVRRFHAHLKGLGGRKTLIPAGQNIRDYDLPLYARLCRQYGLPDKQFARSVVFDLKDDWSRWFWQNGDVFNPSVDGLREYFGMSSERAHRAMFDVRQEAWMLTKLLRLYMKLGPTVQFKGSARGSGGLI